MAFANIELMSADRSWEQDINNEGAEAQASSAGYPESHEHTSKDTSGFISFSDNLHSNEINNGCNDSSLHCLDNLQQRLSHLPPNQGHQSTSVPCHQQSSFQATHAQSGHTTSKWLLKNSSKKPSHFVTSDRRARLLPEDQTCADYLNQADKSEVEGHLQTMYISPDTSVSSGFASNSFLSHNGQTVEGSNNSETDESLAQEGVKNDLATMPESYLATMPESESHTPHEATVTALTEVDKGMLKQTVTEDPFVQDHRYCTSCPERRKLATEFIVPKRSKSSDDLDLTRDHLASFVHDTTTGQTSASLNEELVHRETAQDHTSTSSACSSSSQLSTQEMNPDLLVPSYSDVSLSFSVDLSDLILRLRELCPSTEDPLDHSSEPDLDDPDLCSSNSNFQHTGITHSSPYNSFSHTENCPKIDLSEESLLKQTESLWQHTDTPSQQTTTSSLQTETSEQIVTPEQQNEAVLQKTKTPTQTRTPIQPTETPIQLTETPIQLTETPIQPTETPIQLTEIPPQVTETPAPQTKTPYIEPPAQQIETVRHAETPYQNTSTHPMQTEPPSDETDTSVCLQHSKLEQCITEHVCGTEQHQQPNHPQVNETCFEETMQKVLVETELTHNTTTTLAPATVTQQAENVLLVSSQQTTVHELLPEENTQDVLTSSPHESVSSAASHQTAAEPGDECGIVADLQEHHVQEIGSELDNLEWMNIPNIQEGHNSDVYEAGTGIQIESDDRLNDISLGEEMQARAPPLRNLVRRNHLQHVLNDIDAPQHNQIPINPPWPLPTDIDINGNGVQNFGQQGLYQPWPLPVNINPQWPLPVNINPPWPLPTDIDIHRNGVHNFHEVDEYPPVPVPVNIDPQWLIPIDIDPPWPILTDTDIHRNGDHNFNQE